MPTTTVPLAVARTNNEGKPLRSHRPRIFSTLYSFEASLLNHGTPLPLQPKIKKSMHITRNRKNKTFAIPADAAAMPPNPKTAATSAIIKNVTAQPNIFSPPLAMNRSGGSVCVCFSLHRPPRPSGYNCLRSCLTGEASTLGLCLLASS
jgi:hypothetical protein